MNILWKSTLSGLLAIHPGHMNEEKRDNADYQKEEDKRILFTAPEGFSNTARIWESADLHNGGYPIPLG